eukprot:EG_transcript_21088
MRPCLVLLLLLHLPQCWPDGLDSLCSTPGPPFFIASLAGGLNNQRWCLLTGMLYAWQHNLTYVLPPRITIDETNRTCPAVQRKRLQPFGAIYDVPRLVAETAKHGLPMITTWSRARQSACCEVVHQNDFVSPQGPSIPGYCLGGDRTFFLLRRYLRVTLNFGHFADFPFQLQRGRLNPHLFYVVNPELDLFRRALSPTPALGRAIDSVAAQLQAQIGPQPYAVVHARFEDDFQSLRRRRIFKIMTEEEMTLRLSTHLPPGSPIHVCSGLRKTELLVLCARFRCFQIFDV